MEWVANESSKSISVDLLVFIKSIPVKEARDFNMIHSWFNVEMSETQ